MAATVAVLSGTRRPDEYKNTDNTECYQKEESQEIEETTEIANLEWKTEDNSATKSNKSDDATPNNKELEITETKTNNNTTTAPAYSLSRANRTNNSRSNFMKTVSSKPVNRKPQSNTISQPETTQKDSKDESNAKSDEKGDEATTDRIAMTDGNTTTDAVNNGTSTGGDNGAVTDAGENGTNEGGDNSTITKYNEIVDIRPYYDGYFSFNLNEEVFWDHDDFYIKYRSDKKNNTNMEQSVCVDGSIDTSESGWHTMEVKSWGQRFEMPYYVNRGSCEMVLNQTEFVVYDAEDPWEEILGQIEGELHFENGDLEEIDFNDETEIFVTYDEQNVITVQWYRDYWLAGNLYSEELAETTIHYTVE